MNNQLKMNHQLKNLQLKMNHQLIQLVEQKKKPKRKLIKKKTKKNKSTKKKLKENLLKENLLRKKLKENLLKKTKRKFTKSTENFKCCSRDVLRDAREPQGFLSKIVQYIINHPASSSEHVRFGRMLEIFIYYDINNIAK